MKKILVILFLLWLGFPWEGKAQDDVYRMELGGGVGGCFYLAMPTASRLLIWEPWEVLWRATSSILVWQIKGNLALGHISGETGKDFFPENAGSGDADGGRPGVAHFKRNVIDFGAQFEFNFWGYGIGRGYEGYSRITPYMLIGAGLTLAPKPVQTDAGIQHPGGSRSQV